MYYRYHFHTNRLCFMTCYLLLFNSLLGGCVEQVAVQSNKLDFSSSSTLLDQRINGSLRDFGLSDHQEPKDMEAEQVFHEDQSTSIHCQICTEREALFEGLNTIGIPLQISPMEADYSKYIPILWTSNQGRTSDLENNLMGQLVPGIMGYFNEARISVWGHDGILAHELDAFPRVHLLRRRLLQWLLGTNGQVIGILEGHREWLTVDSFSSQLHTELLDKGVTFQTLEAPLQETALNSIDTLIIGNPWGEISGTELDLIISWLSHGKGLFILGCQWSWDAYIPEEGLDYNYAIYELGQRLGWSYYDGVIIDPDSPTDPDTQPTYRVHPIENWSQGTPE